MSPYMATARHYSAPSPAMDHFQSIPVAQRAEPFVKWAGGKKKLLHAYDTLFPAHFENYHEPFLGGGAVFLFLAHVGRIERAILSDANEELIHLYRTVRDDTERLVAELETYPYERDFYYRLRALEPKRLDPIRRAARMLYLNRTCFNGLYRVNSKGQFNVPIGRYDNPVICNGPNLRNISHLLQGRELQAWGYETVLDVARPGDFVYMDPPHHVVDGGMGGAAGHG
ncbi:MAG: DNA adenine methylase, partial [Myxococcota bacterium]